MTTESQNRARGSEALLSFPTLEAALGFVLTKPSGQSYEVVRAEPYTRKGDGEASGLLTWRTTCPATGQPFEFVTGLRAISPTAHFRVYLPGVYDTKTGRLDPERVRRAVEQAADADG